MHSLHIDLETFSSINISKSGVYRYVEDPSFELLLFAYSADDAPVQVIDVANGETIPPEIISALHDPSIFKCAHNASFERICISKVLGLEAHKYLDPVSWRCTMVWAATLGLPLSLADAGASLGIEKQKLDGGRSLVRHFCSPCTPTKANGGRTRNTAATDPDKWESFKKYNRRDVEAEMEIAARLSHYPVSESVWNEYVISERINDRGVALDMAFVTSAIELEEASKQNVLKRMQHITGVENPNSVMQLKAWLKERGVDAGTLDKQAVATLIESAPPDVAELLSLRQLSAKSSVKKYEAMQQVVCSDGRARGMFQFFGASRTGRWAGRLIQLQNLPQNHLEDLALARELVAEKHAETIEMLFGDIPNTLSQLIRTAFVPREGTRFIVCDYSAIEARVIAWLAHETWRDEVFRVGKDIYCASASQMFGVPVEKHGVNSHLRQKGKIAELALGYGGSAGALRAMGALEMGLTEEELMPLVHAWRDANPNIVSFWWDIDRAALDAVRNKATSEARGISFEYASGILFVRLPSDRRLAYARPSIGENKFGGECITYEAATGAKKLERVDTYGPKLTENIVQATARDLLAHALCRLSDKEIVMHVHDEIVIEADTSIQVEDIAKEMAVVPKWARSLELRADGYECHFYKKD